MGKKNSIAMVDRISVLPKDIIDSILTRLPILEAVRTSVLSQSWRYQWHSLSKIDINHDCMFQTSQPEFENKIVKIIDCILLAHCGPVDKFALSINLETCYDIDRWILYLSRNGIKELTINKLVGEHYSLPSCLFSCSNLTHLKLIKCIFRPPPAAFRVFGNLTELDFDGVVISDKGLESLLNSCPLLSNLSLVAVNPPPSFTINAPNLVKLHINTFCSYSQFMCTPRLTFASFGKKNPTCPHTDNADCKIVELLGSLPNLQSLEFYHYGLQHLAVGDVPERLPLACPIRHLMACVNFEDLQELLAAFCMFRSSPFVQTLNLALCSNKLEARICADGFWEGEQDLSFRLNHLKEVWLTDFTGIKSDLKFIKFLLATAPALKTMVIHFHDNKDVNDLYAIVPELNRFPRVSPKVELILLPHPSVSV